MRMLRSLPALAAAVTLTLPAVIGTAQAQTKITVGKFLGGSGFHIPSYVAMDQGFYKAEGLDATFVSLTGRGAGHRRARGQRRLRADPVRRRAGRAERRRDPLRGRRVAEVALGDRGPPEHHQGGGSQGQDLGYGRAGSADYDEGAAVLRRVFQMEVGKDYKVISFQGEPERIAALVNGDIEAALVSMPHAPKALNAGMKLIAANRRSHPARRRHVLDAARTIVDQNPETSRNSSAPSPRA